MKFTSACVTLIAAVSAQGYGYDAYSPAPYGNDSYGNDSYGHDAGYGSVGSSYGNDSYGGDSYGNTYGHTKEHGYGIYNFDRRGKTLIANDGYKVKYRSDPYERNY